MKHSLPDPPSPLINSPSAIARSINSIATAPKLETTLHSNFDEIAALTAELGGNMDSMFSDLMKAMQPTSATTKCDAVKARIALKKTTLVHRREQIKSLPSSPQKYTDDFEDIIDDLMGRLNEMEQKCNDIPSMQLPSKWLLDRSICPIDSPTFNSFYF
jgi:hypothetical protein